MKKIIIEILKDGSIKIEGKGFKGAECDKATAEMEKALGVAGKKTRTAEFYQSNTTSQRT